MRPPWGNLGSSSELSHEHPATCESSGSSNAPPIFSLSSMCAQYGTLLSFTKYILMASLWDAQWQSCLWLSCIQWPTPFTRIHFLPPKSLLPSPFPPPFLLPISMVDTLLLLLFLFLLLPLLLLLVFSGRGGQCSGEGRTLWPGHAPLLRPHTPITGCCLL